MFVWMGGFCVVGSMATFCVQSCPSRIPVAAFCIRLTPVLRFYCRVLCSSHACCLPPSAKRDGLRYAAFLFRHGSGSPLERSRMPSGYRALRVHFGIARFFMAIPTRVRPETTESAYTKRSAASGGRFFRYRFMVRYDTAGSTLGLRAPDCAKESKVEAALRPLWTLFTLRRGYVCADSPRQRLK